MSDDPGAAPRRDLLHALQAMRSGDFSARMSGDQLGIDGKIADTFNEIIAANQRMAQQLERVGQVVGREGKTRQRVKFGLARGSWADIEGSVNTLIDDLLWPTREVTRAVAAVAQGDLLQTVQLDVDGRPLGGEFLQSANIVNTMIKRLSVFTAEVTRVAREVGTEGKLDGQAQMPEVTGVWKDLNESVNSMAAKLVESEQRRSMAIAAGKMGSWDWDWINGDWMWDEGQYRIFGVEPENFEVTSKNIQALLYPDDVDKLRKAIAEFTKGARSYETEFRIVRPDGEVCWCVGTAAATIGRNGRVVRISGVTVDITERKRAEERQSLLTREVDHRAKNALALAQSIVRLTRADSVKTYVDAVEGRINALARVHTILSLSSWQGAEISKLVEEELAPYSRGGQIRLAGSEVQLQAATAQTLALALHELVTNSAKYGALSVLSGQLSIRWDVAGDMLALSWEETGGPLVQTPISRGFGTRSLMASVESQLGGQALFDWRAEGLICRLLVPLTLPVSMPAPNDHYAEMAADRSFQKVS